MKIGKITKRAFLASCNLLRQHKVETIHWLSELKTTVNTTTGKKFYFIKVCGVFKRFSKDDFNSRKSDADRIDNFLTKLSGDKVFNYCTIYGAYTPKNQG